VLIPALFYRLILALLLTFCQGVKLGNRGSTVRRRPELQGLAPS